ncbi:PAS domain S-box protein [Jeotgalibacillus campisalis]|uniref:histidine kinase n=1 Tax=Jeotgalibacillus campisalis TaxID=220754 RepID=A0A0C2VDY8_9BACL|nr:PAS domain S-box protein [Jeotgalibacillus campisalis]KIL47137.1 histidine kinase [Jeotgalibacillus campisalis]
MEHIPQKNKSYLNHNEMAVAVVDERLQVVRMNTSFVEDFHVENTEKSIFLTDFEVFRNLNLLSDIINSFKDNQETKSELTVGSEAEKKDFTITIVPSHYEAEKVRLVEIIFDHTAHQQAYIPSSQSFNPTKSISHSVFLLKLKKENDNFIIKVGTGSLFEQLQINSADLKNQNLHTVFPKEELEHYVPICLKVWEQQIEATYEGTICGLEYIASVIPVVEEGVTEEIICMVTDISNLKNTQRELERNKQKYQSLMYDHSDNIFLIDRQYIIREINSAAEKRLKMNKNETLIGKNYRDFVRADRCENTKKYLDQALEGTTVSYNTVIINQDHTESHISCTLVPILIDGKVEGAYGVGRDITEIVKMDKKLKKTAYLLEAYFNHTNDGASLLSEDGVFAAMNHKFESIFQWEREELLGCNITDLFHKEQSQDDKRKIIQALKGEDIDYIETTFQKKDGTACTLSLHVSSIRSKKGTLIGIAVIVQDLSKIKIREDLLKKSEQLALVGQLAAGVAHEIRNPLTTLKGFLQLLGEDKKASIYIELLQNELNRIEYITGELLSLAKPQATSFKINSLKMIMDQTVEFIKIEALKNNVKMVLSIEEVMFECESHKIKQVFLNLFMNAIEAMPTGGTLNIFLVKEKSDAVIIIQDTGYGIKEDRLRKLGEPFYSTKEKGTGLGLMICRKIIENHKGTFTIESKPNEGTTVKVTFPLISS